MPRIPDVCPSAFYPLNDVSPLGSSTIRKLPSARRATVARIFLRSLLAAVCLVFFLMHDSLLIKVAAQSATATLSGVVTDETGAVITGVNITVMNIALVFQRSTTTNAEGMFVVPLLPPGNYSVKAEHAGFSPGELNVTLNVNDQREIKVLLKVGSISQTVQIVDSSSLIDQSPAVATIVDRQFVSNLPLNGRSFQSLITLTPGVVLTKTGVTSQGQFSVNGQRANANYFTIDGVGANIGASASTFPGQSGAGSLPGLGASGGTNNLVSVDALEEFKIHTSTFAPEFGRTPGAQVSIVTRSGTKELHGTAFNYLRNDVLDATNWFANANRQPKPTLRQNDFGGVLGGPIYLPRFGEGGPAFHDFDHRLFFFFSYEGLRLRQPLVGISDVPSLAARSAASPAIQPFVNAYPRPNGPEKANGVAAFSASFSNPATLNATSLRIDAVPNSKLTLFGRYNNAPSESVSRGGIGPSLNTLNHFRNDTQTLTLGTTHVFTHALSNDLRFNYSRDLADNFFTLDDFGGAVVPSPSILFSSDRSGADSQLIFSVSGVSNSNLFYGKAPDSLQRQFNIVDGLSLLQGNHQLRFGIDYRRLSPIFNAPHYTQTVTFNGIGNPAAPVSGSLLSGSASGVTVTSQKVPEVAIFNNLSIYAQDQWKATNRLTLTYGLRWELVPPPHGINGFGPTAVTRVADPATIAFAPAGTALWRTTYGNFAPRVGASYQLSRSSERETVLRGGFGLFYDLGTGQVANAFVVNFPSLALRSSGSTAFPLSAAAAASPVAGTAPTASDLVYAFDPELKLPQVYQWNLSLEHSLGKNQSLTASYVAAVGRKLLRTQTISNPNASLSGSFLVTKNTATSDYHAMQLQFQRRLSRGLQGLFSYTWSKSLDISSSDVLGGARDDKFDLQLDRGPSDFDVRHQASGGLTYDIPGLNPWSIGGKILSGWSVDSILVARSALPINVVYGRRTSFGTVTLRPDLVPDIELFLSDPNVPGGRRINNTLVSSIQRGPFLVPNTQRNGTLGRNALRGFPMWQIDFAVRRQFNLVEQLRMQVKAEFFNLFNHPNFGDPASSLGTISAAGVITPPSNFGVSTNTLAQSLGSGGLTGGFNPLYQVGGPRSVQLSLKFEF